MSPSKRFHTTRLAALMLCAVLAAALLAPFAACAQEEQKAVRVGWYETPYNQTDPFGRRSGYAYEYQQKIAAYTGWTYEYVKGSWPELLQMLIDGEIDLMSDISYTVGRAKSLLYSMLPMGAEEYYVENLRGQAGPIDVWNEQAWCLLVTLVTVHADGSAEILFRGENRMTVR